jgi:predicted TIM-barrel fold metal-dependent hydrolase
MKLHPPDIRENAVSEPLIIVSADDHVGAQPETYRPYLEKKYWADLDDLIAEDRIWTSAPSWREQSDEVLEVIDPRHAIRTGGRTGAWDFERRLKEMDAEGVAGQVLNQGHTMAVSLWFGEESISAHSAELRAAGARAHHRWLAENLASANGRLAAVLDPGPCRDMDATVQELRWAAEHGFVAAGIPGILADDRLPPLHDEYFEPYWAACDELNLRLFLHAGYGIQQGSFLDNPTGGDSGGMSGGSGTAHEGAGNATGGIQAMQPSSGSPDKEVFGLGFASAERTAKFTALPRRVMWELMLAGVFDNHPDLRLAVTELRAYWVPAMLAHLDRSFAQRGLKTALKPSEYFARNCAVTPSYIRPIEVAMRHDIGVERLMFATDYPHPESTWPNTKDWIRAAFGPTGIPEAEARQILGGNAIEFFGLDRAQLTRAAGSIGPQPEEVLGIGHQVDPRIIDEFHRRGGFLKPVDDALNFLDGRLEADLADAARLASSSAAPA